jgi:hypothetical protein
MHSPSVYPASSRERALPQPGREEELLQLADDLSEREGIPIEVAYSIVSRHYSANKEARDESIR